MFWSGKGNVSLAALAMVFQNGYEELWFHQGQLSFVMPEKAVGEIDKCA